MCPQAEEITTADRRDAPSVGVTNYRCTVVGGPDAGAVIDIDTTAAFRTLIGTGPACGIRLTDRRVSRRHASLELAGATLRVHDLGSTNGTRIQGVSIIEASLRGGETVQIGETTLRVDALTEKAELGGQASFGRLLGGSTEMLRVYGIAARLAASDISTMIEGETGTGKEVLAESLHDESARREGPFVVIDCTTLAPSLVESELFGHERGAFTGAVGARAGVFEQAHRGTLFIDEIGDLDVALQAKLLRAIERSEIRRVGSNTWTHVDVRVIAATRRDLDRQVQNGAFRDDLFYRLAVGRIELPPLRRRLGDVTLLAQMFWRKFGGAAPVPRDLLVRLEAHSWPGNVRELQNTIARVLALGDTGLGVLAPADDATGIETDDFLEEIVDRGLPFAVGRQHVVAEYERRYVERVLAEHQGHVGKASAASGIGRRYFQRVRNRSTR